MAAGDIRGWLGKGSRKYVETADGDVMELIVPATLNAANNPVAATDAASGSVKVYLAAQGILVGVDTQTINRPQKFTDTTNINAGATWYSASIDAANYRRLVGAFRIDQAGEWWVEHSDDNTNWLAEPSTTFTASVTQVIDKPCAGRYIRVAVTNTGAAATTAARKFGYLSPV